MHTLKHIVGFVGYWALFGVAAILFAAAVLAPEWRDYQGLHAQKATLAAHVQRLSGRLADLQRCDAALPTDAAANQRLARTQLRYRRPGEVELRVPPRLLRPAAAVRDSGPAVDTAQIHDAPYGALLSAANHPNRRRLMLVVAAALMVVAVLVGLLPQTGRPKDIPITRHA
jgi:hypothetical protein